MSRPGDRLRALAASWCCPETMERVVDPLIADLQREHGDARRSGRGWTARLIRIAGTIAFAKVVLMCAWGELTAMEQSAADRNAVSRVVAVAVPVVVVLTVLLELPSVGDYPKILRSPTSMRFLYLAPWPFALALAAGAALGIVVGLSGRAFSRRVAARVVVLSLICSAVTFVNLGWVAPAAGVAYRVTVFGDPDPTPGIGEQSIGALGRRIDEFKRDPAFAHFGFPAAMKFDYHCRVAMSCAPLVLSSCALVVIGRGIRRRWLFRITAVLALVAYGWLLVTIKPWGRIEIPAVLAAWSPNLAVMLASGLVLAARSALRRAEV